MTMLPFLGAVALAFGAVFVAEFGDKSQLLVLAFATRHPALPVAAGLIIAAASIQALSVTVGAILGAALPETAIGVVAGLAFIAVAGWTLWDREDEEDDDEAASRPVPGRRSTLALTAVVAGTIIVSELGDKTMLATMALAARQDPVATWIGASAGMASASLIAVLVGRQVGARLSPRAVRIGSASLFAAAGILVIAGALGAF
jgi:Ca2+/H+ antiporter, TMEM165/GDT1 family